MCYDNGGGAFLIPYMIFLCLIGIPMMSITIFSFILIFINEEFISFFRYLELFLGQFYRCGNITLWGKIAPSMKGIGIASFFIVTAVTLFYTTIIGMSQDFLQFSD